jgi:hypothetical protein
MKTKIEELEIELELSREMHAQSVTHIVRAHKNMLVTRLELDRLRSMNVFQRLLWALKITKNF